MTDSRFDLEDRTFNFANNTKLFVKKLPKSLINIEYSKQLIRSSGSVAANYIEANESLSRKDYYLRVKICRKEAKESSLWLKLCDMDDPNLKSNKAYLLEETKQLTRIFGAILEKQTKG